MRDLAATIAGLVGYEGELVWNADKPNGQPRRRLDVTRAKERFGFEARVSFADGLARTVTWYREQAVGIAAREAAGGGEATR